MSPRKGARPSAAPKESDVRERLLAAAEEVLREDGFLGASARAIAQRAGVATGGIHYHFASVDDLLLAAFDRATTQRIDEYRAMAEAAPDLPALIARTGEAFAEDREQGRFRLLAELMAGSAGGGALAGPVADRTQPWLDLTRDVVERFAGPEPLGLMRSDDIALGLVALFVGLEMLDQLDSERFDTAGMLDRASGVAGLLGGLVGGPGTT